MKSIIKFSGILLLTGMLFHLSCKKETSCEGCRENNKPPIAVAGPDQVITLPTDSVSLNGNASSDPDGTISVWLWTKISGPAPFIISNSSDANSIVKNLIVGTYKFELKVTDDKGLSANDTVQVIVDAIVTANHPPVANAGVDQTITLPTNTVNLDGSRSTDPENNITTYLWTKISGPSSLSILNANAVQTQVINLVQGIYQFELKVTDAGGLFSKDTMQVTVNAQAPPPPLNCGDSTRPRRNAQLIPVGTLSEARRWMSIASAGNKIVFGGGQGLAAYASSAVDIYDITAQTWSTTQLSQPRFGIAAIAGGHKIYFAGGHTATSFTTTSRVDIYDVVSNSWSVADLSEPRQNIAAAVVGNKIFFAGGDSYNVTHTSNTVTDKVDIYDMVSNTWSTATLSVARSYISATTVGNKIYFTGGGFPCNGAFDRIDIYDNTTNTWSVSSLSEPKSFHQSIAVGNHIYWAGGVTVYDCFNDIITSCRVEKRDVLNGTTTTSHLLEPLMSNYYQACLKDNSIVFFTGDKQFDIYNPVSDVWSVGVLNRIIYDMRAFSINNTIYVAGDGHPNPLSNQVWKLEF